MRQPESHLTIVRLIVLFILFFILHRQHGIVGHECADRIDERAVHRHAGSH